MADTAARCRRRSDWTALGQPQASGLGMPTCFRETVRGTELAQATFRSMRGAGRRSDDFGDSAQQAVRSGRIWECGRGLEHGL